MSGRFLATIIASLFVGTLVAAERPTPADVLVREGKKFRDAKDYKAAQEFFEAANTIDPKNPAVLVQLAWVHNEQQEYDKAMKIAQEVLRAEPGNSDAFCELGYAHLKQKQYLKAITSLRKSIEKDDKNWTAYGYLVQALRAVGENEEADELDAARKKKMDVAKVKD